MFFASIGLKTDISGLTPEILLFCICFVIVALLTKIIGCGLAAKICRFNWGDSLKVGVSMMTRGEVALIVAQKGLEVGVVDPVYFTAVILLIVVSSVATPLALKALFTKMPPVPHPSQTRERKITCKMLCRGRCLHRPAGGCLHPLQPTSYNKKSGRRF